MLVNLQGYFRKGCVLEALERYDDVCDLFCLHIILVSQICNIELSVNVQALAAFQVALKYNSQSSEVSKKIKRLTQLASDKRRAAELEATRSNVDMKKHLDSLKTELVSLYFLYFVIRYISEQHMFWSSLCCWGHSHLSFYLFLWIMKCYISMLSTFHYSSFHLLGSQWRYLCRQCRIDNLIMSLKCSDSFGWWFDYH